MARKWRLLFRGLQPVLRPSLGSGGVTRWLMLAMATAWFCTAIAPGLAQVSPQSGRTPVLFPGWLAINQAADPDLSDLLQQGRELFSAGRFAAAVEVWQRLASDLERQGDRRQRALVLSNISLARQQLGQWPAATTAIRTSLSLLDPQVPDDRPVLAQALNTQGSLYLSTGKFEPALESWEQAAQVYQAIADQEGNLRARINQIQAMKGLGLYRRAVTLLIQIRQDLGQQPDSPTKVVGLRTLGNALRSVGDLEQSRRILEQSLAIARQSAPGEVPAIQFSLGNIARTQGDNRAALEFYQQAATTALPGLRLQAQANQLSLLVEDQQVEVAQNLLAQIQPQLSALPASHTNLYTRINLAQSWMKLPWARGNPSAQAIAQLLAATLEQARQLNDPRAESYTLGTLGKLYEQNRQWEDARTVTEQALAIAQSLGAADIAYQWQWQLGRILKAQNQNPGAIAAYSQAVTTLQSLRNDLVAINTDVQFSFRESVEPVYRQLVELLVQPGSSGVPSQENLARARTVIESLQLAELDNFFREACLQAAPVQVDRIDPTAAILYPIILENRLEVILSVPGQPLHHYSTEVRRAEVEQTIAQLRQSLSPISPSRERFRLARLGYDWLVGPAIADLNRAGIKTLVFVLDGVLRGVPMAALYDGSQFLIENYNVALSPGLQLLTPQPLQPQNLQVLTGGLTEARQGFSALPGVAVELQQITTEVSAKLLLNQDLTNQNLIQQLSNVPFNVVHLATHGQFSSNAEETFILTWDDRLKVKQLSDLLRNRDVRSTTPLELLVLSACQTASGDQRAALGLAGVAVRSGARSTVATLWSVNDEAAATLMTRFYQELTQPGMTKAQALRQAQLALLREPQFKQPYYWSPFVLIGNWL